MAGNAFVSFFDKADGESIQKGKEKWVEIFAWDWEIEAETSWTKGGGASVGKPSPGKMSFRHYFDTSSIVIMGYICIGKAFPKVELQMMKTSGGAVPVTYFTMAMEDVFICKVSNSYTDEDKILQNVEMVFKTVKIDYKPLDSNTGSPRAVKTYSWDIPSGKASPSA
jgi:type VI secretion system secreted protein Hcp